MRLRRAQRAVRLGIRLDGDRARHGIAVTGPARLYGAARAEAVARSATPKSRHGQLSLWDRDRGTPPGEGRRRRGGKVLGEAAEIGAGEWGGVPGGFGDGPSAHLMTHTTFRVGHLNCHALEGGRQHLDGGAMFGIVPKALWARR